MACDRNLSSIAFLQVQESLKGMSRQLQIHAKYRNHGYHGAPSRRLSTWLSSIAVFHSSFGAVVGGCVSLCEVCVVHVLILF